MTNHAKLAAYNSAREADAQKTLFGFWVYIMTDCVVFASLFATYAVLHNSTFSGPTSKELFSLPYVLAETFILLTSSYTVGIALLMAKRGRKDISQGLLAITFLLGVSFLSLEINEFRNLVIEGNSWRRSGFLSAYFTLVGTHGLHITAGLIWMAALGWNILNQGLTYLNIKRLTMLTIFWHFLDVIWIFIFTIVYLMGALS